MSLSHAILFIPIILALSLSAALLSMTLMQGPGAHPAGGAQASGTPAPGITGYAVLPLAQDTDTHEAPVAPAENLSGPTP